MRDCCAIGKCPRSEHLPKTALPPAALVADPTYPQPFILAGDKPDRRHDLNVRLNLGAILCADLDVRHVVKVRCVKVRPVIGRTGDKAQRVRRLARLDRIG